jgi:AraC-like DNA-binding protein
MKRIDTLTRYIARNDYIRVWEESRNRSFPDFYNKHEGYELVLISSGECQLCVENRKYLMRPGDVLFMAEGEYHCMNVPEQCTFRYIDFRPNLIFSHPAFRDLILKPFMAGLNGGSHKVSGNRQLRERVLQLIGAAEKGKAGHLQILEKLIGLLAVFESMKLTGQTALSFHRNKVKSAMEMIYTRYAEDISIDEMARTCALSRASFYRHFLKAYKTGPREFINELRMDRAAFLLISTGRKVADIAMSTGYQNLSYFNRLFLKKTGIAPLRYRKLRGLG